jgi:hypothetical protein
MASEPSLPNHSEQGLRIGKFRILDNNLERLLEIHFFEKIVIFGEKVLFTESILELLIRNLWFGVCLTHTSYNKLFL